MTKVVERPAMAPTMCIYHGNCADGFSAAWAVFRRFGEEGIVYHPAIYGAPPPDVTGQHVLMVDFSYPKDVLLALAEKAKSIVILDHHKTAEADLAAFQVSPSFVFNADTVGQLAAATRGKVFAHFDMQHSGAVLAWRYCHPHNHVPKLLTYVEDRDLWRFAIPGTREVQACIFSFPYEFAAWDDLVKTCDSSSMELVAMGEAIERKHFKDIHELLAAGTQRMVIGGHDVAVANLPYTMSSDAGNILAEFETFGACYMDMGDKRVFSLRSRKGTLGDPGFDVSAVAKLYGGGGHHNAAGFRMPLGWSGDNRHAPAGVIRCLSKGPCAHPDCQCEGIGRIGEQP